MWSAWPWLTTSASSRPMQPSAASPATRSSSRHRRRATTDPCRRARRVAARPDQHGQAVPDIEHPQLERALRQGRRPAEQQGANSRGASARPGAGRGNRHQAAPMPAASASAAVLGAGMARDASGHVRATWSITASASVVAAAANLSSQSAGVGASHDKATPASAGGTTSTLNHGTANRLASGATSETRPNHATVQTSRPTASAAWMRRRVTVRPGGALRPATTARMVATAPNDSHRPGSRTASGSANSTSPSAPPSAAVTEPPRRATSAASPRQSSARRAAPIPACRRARSRRPPP
jgi:hypothetical protein